MQSEMIEWMIAEMVEGVLEISTQDPDGAAVTTPVISSAGAILLRVPSGAYFTVELTGSTSPDLSVLASGQIKDV